MGPLGAKATFEFDDGGNPVGLIVGHFVDGNTREEILEYFETHGGPDAPALVQPHYAVGDHFVQLESGVMEVEFRDPGSYGVVCSTAPEGGRLQRPSNSGVRTSELRASNPRNELPPDGSGALLGSCAKRSSLLAWLLGTVN